MSLMRASIKDITWCFWECVENKNVVIIHVLHDFVQNVHFFIKEPVAIYDSINTV